MRFTAENTPRGSYISLNKLMSFTAQIYGVIGAKGYGKTYRFKRYAVKQHIYHGSDIVLLRDSNEAIRIIKEAKGASFFRDIMSAPPLDRHTAKIEGDEIIIDDKHAGQVMPISGFFKYKGNSYNPGVILFDEFIPEHTQVRRGDPAYQFLITLDTFIRDNPKTKVLLTANSLDIGSGILELLGINLSDKKYGYYYNPAKRAVIYYAPNSPEFEERRAKSIAFKLAAGTQYEGSVSKNTFENSIAKIYKTREKCDLVAIYHTADGDAMRVFKARESPIYYVTKDPNPNTCLYMRKTFEVGQVGPNRKYATEAERAALRRRFISGVMEFESHYILSRFLTLIE